MWLCYFNIAGQNGGTFYLFCEEVIDLRGCYPARPLVSEDNIPPALSLTLTKTPPPPRPVLSCYG